MDSYAALVSGVLIGMSAGCSPRPNRRRRRARSRPSAQCSRPSAGDSKRRSPPWRRNARLWAMRSSSRCSRRLGPSWRSCRSPPTLRRRRHSGRSASCSSTWSVPPRSASTWTPRTSSAVMDGALRARHRHRGSPPRQGAAVRRRQHAGRLRCRRGARGRRRTRGALRPGAARTGRALGAEVQAAHGHAGFNVRVGIHTGGVLLGGGVGARRHASAASRSTSPLAWSRPPRPAPCASATTPMRRCAACSRSTRSRPCRSRASTRPSQLPRHARQAALFRIAHARHRRRGHAHGRPRRRIRAAAARLQAPVRASKRLAVVTVVADAGIGKSRLLYEFEAWTEARPETFILFRGRATPQTQSQPFGLLRDILAWRLQIADDDTLRGRQGQDGARHRAAVRCTTTARTSPKPTPTCWAT